MSLRVADAVTYAADAAAVDPPGFLVWTGLAGGQRYGEVVSRFGFSFDQNPSYSAKQRHQYTGLQVGFDLNNYDGAWAVGNDTYSSLDEAAGEVIVRFVKANNETISVGPRSGHELAAQVRRAASRAGVYDVDIAVVARERPRASVILDGIVRISVHPGSGELFVSSSGWNAKDGRYDASWPGAAFADALSRVVHFRLLTQGWRRL